MDGALPKRPLKKIALGKARPAIYYKFNCKTEFSDGAVVIRRSQFPKDEMRLIQDMRNSPMWNPYRSDLEVVDANAGGRMQKFKEKFNKFAVKEDDSKKSDGAEKKETKKAEKNVEEEEESLELDDYLDLLGMNAKEVQTGGKLATKQKSKKK